MISANSVCDFYTIKIIVKCAIKCYFSRVAADCEMCLVYADCRQLQRPWAEGNIKSLIIIEIVWDSKKAWKEWMKKKFNSALPMFICMTTVGFTATANTSPSVKLLVRKIGGSSNKADGSSNKADRERNPSGQHEYVLYGFFTEE